MYFIKYQLLKEKLKNRTLSDREALPYYVLFCVLTAIVTSFSMGYEMNEWDYLSGIVTLIATVSGTIYAYNRNGGGNGYDFIQKAIVLGWVVIFRLMIVYLPVVLIVYAFTRWVGIAGESTAWVDVVMAVIFFVVYYQRFGRHLQDTIDKTGENLANRSQ